MGKLGLKFVEAGLAEADGDVADHAGYCSTDAIVVVTEVFDDFCHARSSIFARTAGGDKGVNGLAVDLLDKVEKLWVG